MSLSDEGGGNSPRWIPTITTALYPTAAQFADSLNNVTQTINSVPAIRVNALGRLFVNVPAGTKSLTVWVASNAASQLLGYDGSLGVYIDGAWSTSISPGLIDGLGQHVISLDGSAHIVQIWNGSEIFLFGSYVWAVSGVGISIGSAPSVTRRLAVYGDSIADCFGAVPPAQNGWFALIRGIYPGACSLEAFGGRQLWDDSGSGSGQIGFATPALLAARLAGLVAGATTREIWLAIGINDVTGGHYTAAQFGTAYAALLDAINAADSGAHVYAASMTITTTAEGSAPAFRSQIQTVATARPSFCTFVDGTACMTTGGLDGAGLHPNNTGHQGIALGTGAAAGSASVRAALGV